MMGSLASLDSYLDPMTGLPTGGVIPQAEPPQDPREFTSDWARIAGAHPGPFEPQGTQWPQYPPRPQPADDRPPFVMPRTAQERGAMFGTANPTPEQVAALQPHSPLNLAAADMALPSSPTDAAMMLVPGGMARKAIGGGIGSLFSADPAEAGKASVAKKVAGKIGEVLNPANKAGTAAEQIIDTSGWANAPYIQNPQRVANPGIYKRPDVIAAEAAARVEPEHPALKQLFGVTRAGSLRHQPAGPPPGQHGAGTLAAEASPARLTRPRWR